MGEGIPEHYVYGYIRTAERNDVEARRLRREIGRFCEQQGLSLITVFCDQGCDGSEVSRPGFSAALDVLSIRFVSMSLVVPDMTHLTPKDDDVRETMLRLVQRAGSKVESISQIQDEHQKLDANNGETK